MFDVAALLSTIAILVIAGTYLSPFKTLASGVSFFVFYAAISTKWYDRREPWFWPVILVLAGLHVLAIIFLDFAVPRGPAMAYVTPFMFADGFAVWGIVNLIEKRFATSRD